MIKFDRIEFALRDNCVGLLLKDHILLLTSFSKVIRSELSFIEMQKLKITEKLWFEYEKQHHGIEYTHRRPQRDARY